MVDKVKIKQIADEIKDRNEQERLNRENECIDRQLSAKGALPEDYCFLSRDEKLELLRQLMKPQT